MPRIHSSINKQMMRDKRWSPLFFTDKECVGALLDSPARGKQHSPAEENTHGAARSLPQPATIFYRTFLMLCKTKGVSPTVAARESGVASGSPTAWKRGSIPQRAQREKLCAYFGVTESELMGDGLPAEVSDGLLKNWGNLSEAQKTLIREVFTMDDETICCLQLIVDTINGRRRNENRG